MKYITEISQVTFIEPFKIYMDEESFIIKFNDTNREYKCDKKTLRLINSKDITLHEKLIIDHVFDLNKKEFNELSNKENSIDFIENNISLPNYVDYTDSMVLFDLDEIALKHRAYKHQVEMEEKQLEEMKLEKKVKLEDDEYQVLLYEKATFDTAYETLNYIFEKYPNNQKAKIMTTIEDDYKTIFQADKHRKIHIYEDKKDIEKNRREFIENILENHPQSHVHIILCVPEDTDSENMQMRTSDIIGNDMNKYSERQLYSKYSIRVITDNSIDEISTRIVIGA